jgi:YD repeat-containing protein
LVTNAYFDGRGATWSSSVPYLYTSAHNEAFLQSDWAGYGGPDTRPELDELGRTTKVTPPGGQYTETTYDGWDREALDQHRHKRRFEQDWAGRTAVRYSPGC